jgi:single-stranded-DNA-specific exonuclease
MEAPEIVREWVFSESHNEGWEKFVTELDISPVTARILYRRGMRDIAEVDAFLNPTLKHLHDPFLMKGMRRAVREVLRSIDSGERIVVHGDYDVDGICSVGVLYGFLKELGADVHYYIPQRSQDGYGLNVDTVRQFHTEGVDLIITTDCGISNHSEIKVARTLGMRVVVVDHHTIPDVLPNAHAILNPLQTDCKFPFKGLAAVGVTFNYVIGIRSELRKRGIFKLIPEPDLKQYLDLVALGTVADVVPLVDENRIFVRLGLEVLAARRRAGVSALMDRAAVEVGPITTRTIGFRLAPRLNAAGRMADASICVELLTTTSYGRATEIAEELESLNKARQGEEREILDSAYEQAATQAAVNRRILVVFGHDWNRGVLGIVASRLMERYHRPAILMGVEGGFAKGSARSIQGINVVDVLSNASDCLTSFGGHSSAAGLSLQEDQLDRFQVLVDEAMDNLFAKGPMPQPRLEIDAIVSLGEVDEKFQSDLALLAPFGAGHPEPLLMTEKSRAVSVKVVGNKHLRVRFRDETGSMDGFGFAMGDEVGTLDGAVAIAFIPRFAYSGTRSRLEIQIKGMKRHAESAAELIQEEE